MIPAENSSKIGNALLFITDKLGPTYLTKVLKLLYLIDETSVNETGVPFSWLEYKAWKQGPVPEALYHELKSVYPPFAGIKRDLDKYISVEIVKNPVNNDSDSYIIRSSGKFNDDDFTDYELDLIDRILNKYGKYSATDLVHILHQKGTLWHDIVSSNKLFVDFQLQSNTSNYTIPFIDLIKGDSVKELAYQSAFQANRFYSLF